MIGQLSKTVFQGAVFRRSMIFLAQRIFGVVVLAVVITTEVKTPFDPL